jgi:hypothetical protein
MKSRIICLARGRVVPGMALAAATNRDGRVLRAAGTVLDTGKSSPTEPAEHHQGYGTDPAFRDANSRLRCPFTLVTHDGRCHLRPSAGRTD